MTTPPFPATPERNRPAHETTPQEMTNKQLGGIVNAIIIDEKLADAYGTYEEWHHAKAEASRRLRSTSEPASQLEQARSATASPDAREELVKCARAMFELIDDQLSPTNSDGTVHICGPDANCDASCADKVAFAGLMCAWNEIITKAEATPAQGSTLMPAATERAGFQREARYHTIKLKTGKPVNCVVVEADWPMYEAVWKMIEEWAATPATERHVSAQGMEEQCTPIGKALIIGNMEIIEGGKPEMMTGIFVEFTVSDIRRMKWNPLLTDVRIVPAQRPGAQPNEGGGK